MPLPEKAKWQLTTPKHIENLDLSETGVTDDDMAELVELAQRNNVKIDHINLYRTNISDQGAKFLAQLTDENVGLLSVSCCDITDEGAEALFRSKIQRIDIGDNNLTDKSVDVFIREGKQTYLILNRNRRISQAKMLEADKKIDQNKRETDTPKYSSPASSLASSTTNGHPTKPADIDSSTWLSNFSIYKYRGSSPNKIDAQPTVEVSVGGHQVNISSAEAENLVLRIMESLLQLNSASDKQFLQKLQSLKDSIEQIGLADTNKAQPSH